jgi:ADP-heptose:LPS heptosyltransferase
MRPSLPTNPRSILVVRADNIGDHVLAAGMLPLLRERFPQARITLACPGPAAGLFRSCPCVDGVVTFHKRKLHRNPFHRLALAWTLRRLRADLALNTVFSRDSASDLLCRMSGAPVRVAHGGDGRNLKTHRRERSDRIYTHLVPSLPGPLPEQARHAAFLEFLGIRGELRPTVWISPEDRREAADLLAAHGLEGRPCLAFFPATAEPIRAYPHFARILAPFLERTGAPLVCLGAAQDREGTEAILQELSGTCVNLCGRTSLPVAAAILERCRLGFGSETGLAHLATAVGLPHVVLVGGGYFGRFMPTSPLTSVLCVPLACYGCAWNCPWEGPHCIRDLAPGPAALALGAVWEDPRGGPRVFPLPFRPRPGAPEPLDPGALPLGVEAQVAYLEYL